jgi:predicted DNA-binding transcriptional regulator YafY
MRADRLLSILLLLQIHRRMTSRELAERMEVSERTIHRDMGALGAAGVPVVAERGAGGGWSLMEGYRTNLTGLNENEVLALFVTGPASLLADLKLEKASDAALIKLLASLPSASRRDAEYARQRIHIDVSGWNREEEAFPCLHTIQEAVWRERRLRISYARGADECPVGRVVDPLGLVAKGSVWYLVALVDGDSRSYRVSRVREAEILDEPCERPADFDLAGHWERSNREFKSKFPRFEALFRARREVVPRLYMAARFARVERVGDADEDGWAEVLMRFQFEWEAREFALGMGTQVELIEPRELRAKVLRTALAVAEVYGQDG